MITDSIDQPGFAEAFADYYYLLNKCYPEKAILKLIGDRYQLSGKLRTILQRGVWAEQNNLLRGQRITHKLNYQELIIDGYNVIFTLLNYKMGRPVFISTDNFCRDAGSLFGKIKKQELFKQALIQIIEVLVTLKPDYVHFYFDQPVSFSAEHKLLTEKILTEKQIPATVHLVKSADSAIIHLSDGIICTSDSNIIDRTKNSIADLSLLAIQHFYKPDLLNLRLFIDALI